MNQLLEIDVDSYGVMFSTAPYYFSVSWGGLALALGVAIAWKVYRHFRPKQPAF